MYTCYVKRHDAVDSSHHNARNYVDSGIDMRLLSEGSSSVDRSYKDIED